MSDPLFRRVLLICDAACNIQLAVTEAASLAARWGAALHGVYVDDENFHRFAALPFRQHVSLSAAPVTQELTAETMERLSSALGAHMRRAIAEVAQSRGLQWTYAMIRDLASAASISAQQDDLLVVETARAFSGAWRPHVAWERSAAAFTGTVLFKGRGTTPHGFLVLLPEGQTAREKVLAAAAALSGSDDEILIVGKASALAEGQSSMREHFPFAAGTHVKTRSLNQDLSSFEHILRGRQAAIVVVHADDVGDWLDHAGTDVLIVR